MTPPTPGAVAIIELRGDIDTSLARLNITPVPIGAIQLRSLCGIDRGLIARWSQDCCHLMPHGGSAVLRALFEKFARAGIPELQSPRSPDGQGASFPEASSPLEARMLAALARAASPLAIDLLLDQPRRWSARADNDPALDRVLNRLVDPPLVVALGPSNIGKSTLVNALAGRAVSIVADEPGTTRDHVGVALDLGGLVVRYADTPGIRAAADEIESRALSAALDLARSADLLVLCGDGDKPPPKLERELEARPRLLVALRHDLGRADWPHDVSLCTLRAEGVSDLVALVREMLVPGQALDDPRPWRFWNSTDE